MRWLPLALGLGCFGLLAAHFAFTCDDGYISFRYARNLAEGRGLVFNPLDTPRVEGYSNFLWTLVLAGLYRLGATGTSLGPWANALSIAAGALLLVLVVRAAERLLGVGPRARVLTALFLGTLVPFALWSTSGLETMPFSLALFATYERLEGRPEGRLGRGRGWQAGVAAAAAGLLRADGFLWLAVLFGMLGLAALARRDRALARALATAGALAAVAIGAHFLWRHAYYGDWLPNTAHVKVGSTALGLERGLKYLLTQVLSMPALALVPLLALAARGPSGPRDQRAAARGVAWRSGGLLAFGALYSVQVGGDFMPMGRFLVPTLPFLALLAAFAFENLARRGTLRAVSSGSALMAVGLAIGLDWLPLPQSWLQALHFRWNTVEARTEYVQWLGQKDQAERWARVGRALALYTRPGESIIRGPVGAVGYFTDLEVLDQNGLVTLEVARRDAEAQRVSPGHDKHVEPDFFLPRRPTYLAATILPLEAPKLADLTDEVIKLLQRDLAVLELRRLRPKDGFPPGLELRVFRFR